MPAPVYRAAPASRLRIVPLDSLTAIYDRASGQTHLVAAPAPEILAVMGETPVGAVAVLAKLADRFELADPDVAVIDARLAELAAIGLVERIGCDAPST